MTATSFRFQELTSEASLNHVVIGPAGGIGIEGWIAEDACSRDALHTLATEHGLNDVRREHLADDLAAGVGSPDTQQARSAAAVLHTFGLRLGALIATLRDPATADRQGTTPYRRAFLARWTAVEDIWLAGGLLAGRCGPLVLEGVKATASFAPGACRVAVQPRPELAPLVGAARHISADSGSGAAVVADLGHTRIKTAIAERDGNTLRRLHSVRAQPTPDGIEAAVDAALIQAVRDAAVSDHVHVIVSVASFVQDGLPADDGQGIYGYLTRRAVALRRRIRNATGVSVDLRYLHDGTAAASAAGTADSATITAGTWLGVGFLPAGGEPLLTVAQRQPSIAWAGDPCTSATALG